MSDLISRQQVIDALKEKVFHNLSDEFYGAIQVLDELPSAQPDTTTDGSNVVKKGGNDEDRTSGDCISRRTAIDAICEDGTWLERQGRVDITMAERKQRDVDIISNLPSIQPEIIRCKDCLIHGVCRFEQGLGLNGYCSQAKRRTDG